MRSIVFYDRISNRFPSGRFEYVEHVSLFDERPFDHNFFLRIARAFPLLKYLTVTNIQAQDRNLVDDNQHLSTIEYPSLVNLYLREIHDDYVEQFLNILIKPDRVDR